jgi:hypothetical protein
LDYNKGNNAMTYIQQREIMIQYLKLKVFLEDWHGVADAAMDIRELEAKYGKEIYEEKN